MRRQKTRLPLLVQGKRNVRCVENRLIEKDDTGAPRNADLAVFVDVDFVCTYKPVVMTGSARRIARLLQPVQVRAEKQHSFGAAASLQVSGARCRRRGGAACGKARLGRCKWRWLAWNRRELENRLVHEAALSAEVEPQIIPLEHVALLLESHVARGFELLLRAFIAQPIAEYQLTRAAQLHVAFGDRFLFRVSLQPISFDE